MLPARIKRNPARMYFAALLPLCKNLIMDGKLRENYGGQLIVYYKWVCRLTKLYPPVDGRSCRRENHIWRHNPKTQKSSMSRHLSKGPAACFTQLAGSFGVTPSIPGAVRHDSGTHFDAIILSIRAR